MRAEIAACAFLWIVLAGAGLGAQAAPLTVPPIRPLGPTLRVSRDSFGYIASVNVLSDGRVLANDTQGNRLVLFDSSLSHFTTVIDTSSATDKAYGALGGWLFSYIGDSSLFADWASLSFLLITPSGKIGRVLAAPLGPGGGLLYLTSAFVDPLGNVLSQWDRGDLARMRANASGPGGQAAAAAGAAGAARGAPADPSVRPAVSPDSTAVLRVNIQTRKVDTIVWLMAPSTLTGTAQALRNSLPVSDAWTMLRDGTVAAVREHDYHVDWFAPDGAATSTPRIAHEWERITDSAKAALIRATQLADSTGLALASKRRDSSTKATGVASDPGRSMSLTRDGQVIRGGQLPQYMSPDDLPDYYPPFPRADSLGHQPVRADADGNLWIQVNLPMRPEGGVVYDVVSRSGRLVGRVQIPGGTHLVGFGPGVAYLTSREGAAYKLARARIH
ncbi:MAG TPA: hypothetical protein VMH39_05490 [Gemmatimonadaceae bacterium]|nr:hypothetical protein [Gemmatimonadaceae bacterium]